MTIQEVRNALDLILSVIVTIPNYAVFYYDKVDVPEIGIVNTIEVYFPVWSDHTAAISALLPTHFPVYEEISYREIPSNLLPLYGAGIAFKFKTTNSGGGI